MTDSKEMFMLVTDYSRSYTAIDDLPSHINPFVYKQLGKWGFDGESTNLCYRFD